MINNDYGPQLYLKCEMCETFFEHHGHKRRRWCSDRCKIAAWRKHKAEEESQSIAVQHKVQPEK